MNVCKDHFARVLTCKGVYNILKYLKVCLHITMNSSTNSRVVPRHPRTPPRSAPGKNYHFILDLSPASVFNIIHCLYWQQSWKKIQTIWRKLMQNEKQQTIYLSNYCTYIQYNYVNKMSPYSTVITQ